MNFGFSGTGLTIANLNIQHLLPKLDELKCHLSQTSSPKILGLCETFLHDNIKNNELQIKNYKFERKDRKVKKGGGIITYINEGIVYKRRYDLEINDIESIWIQIFCKNRKSFLINFVYRPPNSNQAWIDLYEAQLEIADCSNHVYYLLGDFNINYVNRNSQEIFNNTKWADITVKFGLEQLVKTPTRISKSSSTIIDHIYTNCSYKIKEVFVSELAISDHFPICLTFSTIVNISKKSKHDVIKYRSFKKFDENAFQSDLLYSGLEYLETVINPNDALNIFYDILNKTLSKHAPIKEKRVKYEHQVDWFNEEIKTSIRERDYYKKIGNHSQYKTLRNKIPTLIKKSKRNFFNNAIKDNKDSSYLWKNLKDISNLNHTNRIELPQKLMISGVEIGDDLNIVKELNKHFISISNIVTKTSFSNKNFLDLKKHLDLKLENITFDIKFITPFEVRKIIDKLNINKSTGLDGIGPRILKYCGDTITPCIASIINNSISSGVFPDKLKEARVLPIFKSGVKEEAENYRPISILPTISKIYERHIATQIHTYFENNDIIHKRQSGFRKNHSCNTALTRLIDAWINDVDSGKIVGVVFLDLRKAFDLVDHQILMHKLKLYHFSENTVRLFKSYLSNRQQMVKVGNIQSDMLTVESGVPQGSILGPLLFLLYINDVTLSSQELNIDLYADDSTLYESGLEVCEIQNKLQSNINNIVDWCVINNMSVHPLKTKCMLIGSRHKLKNTSNLYLTINDNALENVTVQKLLGVFIDNKLNWHAHIDYVCKNLNRKISLLKHVLYFLTDDMKTIFYNSYLLPIFDYCCVLWGKDNKNYINKINILQKRAAKIILNKPIKTPTKGLFKSLNWLSFNERCKYHSAVLIYKVINQIAPAYLLDILTFSRNEKHNLRSSIHNDLVLQKIPRTNYYKDSFSYYSMKVWNDIPVDIRSVPKIQSFKSKYKKYLLKIV
jgi:hypothetical protein